MYGNTKKIKNHIQEFHMKETLQAFFINTRKYGSYNISTVSPFTESCSQKMHVF